MDDLHRWMSGFDHQCLASHHGGRAHVAGQTSIVTPVNFPFLPSKPADVHRARIEMVARLQQLLAALDAQLNVDVS